jgi:predicted alpha/beta hydrolase
MEDTALDAYLFHREDRRAPASNQDVTVAATDGVRLACTLFRGGGPAVVVSSATGVRRRFYAPFANWLAGRGFDVLTFDYRGIGDSPSVDRASMHDWGERDLAGVLAALGAEYGKVAIVGHSVGGQLPGLLPNPDIVSKLVSIAGQSGDYRLWPMPRRLAMAALWYGLVPGVTRAVGYLPGVLGVGEDLPPGVALEWARWCRTPGYLVADAAARHPERELAFGRLHIPLLAVGFEGDPYAPAAAVDALVALYRHASVERRQVMHPRLGHFGFFRGNESGLWTDVATFLERR